MLCCIKWHGIFLLLNKDLFFRLWAVVRRIWQIQLLGHCTGVSFQLYKCNFLVAESYFHIFYWNSFAITLLYPKMYTFAVYKKWKWRKSLICKFQDVDIKSLYWPWKHENNKEKKNLINLTIDIVYHARSRIPVALSFPGKINQK